MAVIAIALSVEHEGRAPGTVTISSGFAVFPDHGTTSEAILARPRATPSGVILFRGAE